MGSSSAAPWKQLLLSSFQANFHLKHSSYFQLATISSNSRPSNRTVVFRGFQDNSDKILINTDTRSHKGAKMATRLYKTCSDGDFYRCWWINHEYSDEIKIDDLKHCSFAEICWYFTETWEQFRISGPVDVIDGTSPDPVKLQQRENSWFESSPRSRLQYMGPTPRLPALSDSPSQTPSLDPSLGPVPAFCVLVLDPDQVDYLNLKSNERLIFTSGQSTDGQKLWNSERVNP